MIILTYHQRACRPLGQIWPNWRRREQERWLHLVEFFACSGMIAWFASSLGNSQQREVSGVSTTWKFHINTFVVKITSCNMIINSLIISKYSKFKNFIFRHENAEKKLMLRRKKTCLNHATGRQVKLISHQKCLTSDENESNMSVTHANTSWLYSLTVLQRCHFLLVQYILPCLRK